MSKKCAKKKSPTEEVNIEDDKEKLQEHIQALRELLKEEKNLKIRTDDVFLLRFLRWVNFDTELAFTKMKDVYKFRAEEKKWFCSVSPYEHEAILNRNIQTVLHDRDSKGRRVYVIKLYNVDTRYVSLWDFTYCDDIWMETILMEEETQKNGLAVILDMSGYSWKLFSWLTPHNNRTSSKKLDCLTIRSLDIHVVNTSFLLNASIALVYPFLDAKVKERIHFHSQDWPSLHKYINPDILPEEYGGKLPNIDYDKLRTLVFNNSDQLVELFNLGYVDT